MQAQHGDWPFGSSEMAQRIRTYNWASTSLGAIEGWPQSQKTAVEMMLASSHAMQLAWGAERIVLYNDAFVEVLGDRHPGTLGVRFREIWPDSRKEIEPFVDRVFAGETARLEDTRMGMRRDSGSEDVLWSFSWSPVRDESGAVAGLLNISAEASARRRAERAEGERDAATARLHALVNASSDVIFRVSPDWTEMRRLDGRGSVADDTDAPPFQWLDEHVFPEDRATVLAVINEAIARKGVFELEYRVRDADAAIGWVSSRAIPIVGPDGDIVDWIGARSDITLRKEAKAALHASEETNRAELERQVRERTAELQQSRDLLQATMDSSMDMIQVFEAIRSERGDIVDFRWVLNNHTSESMYGEVCGESLLERNPGVVEEGIFDTFKRVVETGEPVVAERHYVHEQFNGWFFQSAVQLGDGVATTTKEITAWKEAQEEVLRLREEIAQAKLRESEEKYRTLFESIDEGFCIIEMIHDAAGQAINCRFVEANRAFERHTGLQNLVGRLTSALTPNAESDWLVKYGAVARTGEPARFENYDQDTGRWYRVYASRVGSGERCQVAIVFDDITDRKENEQQQSFLLRLSDAMRPLADAAAIQSAATRLLGEALGVDRAYYVEVDEAEGLSRVEQEYTQGVSPSLCGVHRVADFGWVIPPMRRGEIIVVEDTDNSALISEADRAAMAAMRIAAHVSAPLVKNGGLAGALCVTDREPRRWRPTEITLVCETAERIWAAVERARAEAALRQREEHFRTLFESIDEGYCIMRLVRDAQGRILDFIFTQVNPAFDRHTGLGDVVGRTVSELLPNFEQHWIDLYTRVIDTGTAERYENYVQDVGRWYRVHLSVVGDSGSNLVAAVFEDITERQRRELALRESEERQAFLLKLSDALRAEPNADGVANRALRMLAERMQLDRCYLTSIRLEDNRAEVTHQVGNDRVPPLADTYGAATDFPESYRVMSNRTLIIEGDFKQDISEAEKRNLRGLGMRALISAALRKSENRPLWGLTGLSASPRTMDSWRDHPR